MTCCCDANEALRRDNADLTVQKDRLIAEAETLRQRVASLERDVTHFDSLTKNLHEVGDHLRAENARLKVDLMNARANADTHIWIGDWRRRF